MGVEVLMLLVGLGVPAGLVAVISHFRLTARLRLIDLVRFAVEAQRPLPADVLRAISGTTLLPSQHRDLRRGVVLAAVGASFWIFGLVALAAIWAMDRDAAAITSLVAAGLGAIPGCLGVGYILLSRDKRDPSED
jgi:hypothetical protein